jgi:hypothetical protein
VHKHRESSRGDMSTKMKKGIFRPLRYISNMMGMHNLVIRSSPGRN